MTGRGSSAAGLDVARDVAGLLDLDARGDNGAALDTEASGGAGATGSGGSATLGVGNSTGLVNGLTPAARGAGSGGPNVTQPITAQRVA
jgi:hypothetical protein